jgi:hypothetical protein
MFLSQWLLANDTPPDTVAVRGNTFLFADFVRFVVKGIGEALCGGSCLLIDDHFLTERVTFWSAVK